MLGFTSYYVQSHPREAMIYWVYSWVYAVFEVGVFSSNREALRILGLTEIEIRKAKVREKPYSMGDGGGLYLWVTPAGGRLWRWSYRLEGKEKLMSLGKYPDVSLAQARERHGEARKLFASGVDPMAQRKAEKNAEKAAVENSFQSISALWLEH